MEGTKDWWKTFFDDFRPVFPLTTMRERTTEARKIIKMLGLKKGQRFLDCPCGYGRISLPMAKMGIKVTGVDITRSYLDEYAAAAKKHRVTVELVREDMRRVKFKSRFDAAANLFTSIGYFADDTEEIKVFRRMFEALKPGGRFLLMTINRDWIIVNFVSNNWQDVGGIRVLQRRELDYSRSVMLDEWHFIKDGETKVHQTYLRLFSYHELGAMLTKVGFVDIRGVGRDGEPTGRMNREMFILANKPG